MFGSSVFTCVLLFILLMPFCLMAENDKVIATLDGEAIFQSQVDLGQTEIMDMKAQLEQMHTELLLTRIAALDDVLLERALSNEAKRRDISVEELLQNEVRTKIPLPTEDEVKEFIERYADHGERPSQSEMYFAQMTLMEKNYQASKQAYAKDLLERAEVTIVAQEQRRQVLQTEPSTVYEKEGVTASRHIRGNPDAPVHAIVYSDFDCGYCVDLARTLDSLVDEYNGQFSYSFHHYPGDESGMLLAIAAECGAEQGAFWELHDAFWNISDYEDENLDPIALRAGIDLERWKSCRFENHFRDVIEGDRLSGDALALPGTPATILNGVKVVGARAIDQYRTLIDYSLRAI